MTQVSTNIQAGARIQEARKRLRLTQAELGAKVGVVKATVGRWENGLWPVNPMAWQGLADALGVAVSWLKDGLMPNRRRDVTSETGPFLGSAGAPSVLAKFSEAKKVLNEVRKSKSATTSFRLPAETKAMFKELAEHYGLDQVEVLVILIHSAHKDVFGSGEPSPK